jgi:heat shock protein HtpX
MWNQLKTIALLAALTTLTIGIVSYLAPGWTLAVAVVAVFLNLGTYFFSDRLVLRIHRAREIAPNEMPVLHRMNIVLARAAGVPAPRLYVIDADYANAFATGRGPRHAAIAVTHGLLRQLTRRQLQGVLAHEMAHVANRDILIATIAGMLAAAVSAIANAVQFSALFGGGQSEDDEGGSPLATLAMAFVAPIAASLVQLAISRSREYVADATAARLTGDPEGLASALEQLTVSADAHVDRLPAHATASLFIVNPLAGVPSRLLALFSTHPPIEQRVYRLRSLAVKSRRVA